MKKKKRVSSRLAEYFGLTPGMDWRTEAIAGATTFFTMAYIIVVNPSILASNGTGMSFNGVLTATVLLAFLMTLFMGIYARLPFAVAPGMGINAFFTFTIIIAHNVPWRTALGMVFWSGALFVVVSATPLRAAIANAIPPGLRSAAAAGIGIFLTFIGLKNAGFVVADPATFVTLGKLDGKSLLSIVGVGVTVTLMRRKSPFAFLGGIFVVTVAAWMGGMVQVPKAFFSKPDFHSSFLQADLWGALRPALIPAIFSLLLTDLFDSISTFVGVAQAAKMVDSKGQLPRLKEGLLVDAFATMTAGIFGTSSGTAYIESSAGIEMGGRTGLTSVFTALCFLPCFFLAPLAGMVPAYATAPVLIVIGALMFQSTVELRYDKLEDAIPTYLTIVLIPLTFSITQGILWGFISHVGLYYMAGRQREIAPMMWGISAVSVVLIWLEHS